MGVAQVMALKPFLEPERSWIGWNALAWAIALPLIFGSWDAAHAVLQVGMSSRSQR
jgi:hypothetical protein